MKPRSWPSAATSQTSTPEYSKPQPESNRRLRCCGPAPQPLGHGAVRTLDWIRTSDLRLRTPALCSAELQGHECVSLVSNQVCHKAPVLQTGGRPVAHDTLGWYPRKESNLHLQLRRLALCPLSHKGVVPLPRGPRRGAYPARDSNPQPPASKAGASSHWATRAWSRGASNPLPPLCKSGALT